jgi:hypothetical protein
MAVERVARKYLNWLLKVSIHMIPKYFWSRAPEAAMKKASRKRGFWVS